MINLIILHSRNDNSNDNNNSKNIIGAIKTGKPSKHQTH